MMRADAGLHADQARRQLGESRLHLATRPSLPQYDRTTPIVPYDVERVLADIDADHRDRAIGLLRYGVLLVFAAPSHILLLAGLERGRTIPLVSNGACRAPPAGDTPNRSLQKNIFS
jgi:hypothetical protein